MHMHMRAAIAGPRGICSPSTDKQSNHSGRRVMRSGFGWLTGPAGPRIAVLEGSSHCGLWTLVTQNESSKIVSIPSRCQSRTIYMCNDSRTDCNRSDILHFTSEPFFLPLIHKYRVLSAAWRHFLCNFEIYDWCQHDVSHRWNAKYSSVKSLTP